MYLKDITIMDTPIAVYDLEVSHNFAVSLEMHALDLLIKQSSGKNRQDFIRRKKQD